MVLSPMPPVEAAPLPYSTQTFVPVFVMESGPVAPTALPVAKTETLVTVCASAPLALNRASADSAVIRDVMAVSLTGICLGPSVALQRDRVLTPLLKAVLAHLLALAVKHGERHVAASIRL